ncbi:MAG: M23 family metallopeptidase [Thermodesulfobacteriota bacterium]|nr:M23 family metallopeptidase [Thermodesulfobacteriota bacterium]
MRKDKTGKKRFRRVVLGGLLSVMLVAGIYCVAVNMEGTDPAVEFSGFNEFIGPDTTFTVRVSDAKSGVKSVWIGLLTGGEEYTLVDRAYPPAEGLDETLTVQIDPAELGIEDGTAMLRIVARDHSWRGWMHGNRTYIEKDVTIDTRRPDVQVLSRHHYINQGGGGLVIYRVSETETRNGVKVGQEFYPGYAGRFSDSSIHLAFFALRHDQGKDTKISVSATDRAGNTGVGGFYYLIKSKPFKKDRLNISDRFLNMKMPEFQLQDTYDTLVEKFVAINSGLRKENMARVREVCQDTAPTLHWGGDFVRLPNSARRASFADHRDYFYNDRKIDEATHMGIDLASYANSDIPAANSGRVIFGDRIGIFGRTVIIDHGFGLFSMYSHLNQVDVTSGQMVEKGETIGRTGTSGLAAGDHLHFGMIVDHTFVNPVEWWDATWITNNITSKIDAVASREGMP